MTHEHEGRRVPEAETDQVGQLLRLAGRRPVPDTAQMAIARAAAHAEWARLVRRRRHGTFRALAASAFAACLVALVAWYWLGRQTAPVIGPDVATLRTSAGTSVTITSVDGRSAAARAGARLRAGDRIEVPAAARAAFTLPAGGSVRLDERTVATLESIERLTLTGGAVYVDAGNPPASARLVVRTPLGDVRHVGTQFEARLHGRDLRVRVREGAVIVERGGGSWRAQAGEGLLIGAEGLRDRVEAETSGPEWAWVTSLAEPFQLEGASVPAFLDWVGREQGWQWEYDRPSLRRAVERIVLHGSIDGLTPEEALAAVLPTCGLAARRRDGILVISDPREARPSS